jgi:5-methylcytosine-specific restriction protein A
MVWTPRTQGFSKAIRQAVLRKHRMCNVCGINVSVDVDHIIPVFEGGDDTVFNAQGICKACHKIKTQHESSRARSRAPRARRSIERHPGLK